MSFAATFTFARPVSAPFRVAGGSLASGGADVPRFDHDSGGAPIGLLVGAGAEMGQGDRVRLRGDVALPAGPVTVLHERARVDGKIVRRAHYTLAPRATIDGCLGQLGHHRAIGAVAGFLPIRRGAVFYRGKRWGAPAIVVGADGTAVSLATGLRLLAG